MNFASQRSAKLACEAARHWDEVAVESKKRKLATLKNDAAKGVITNSEKGTTRSILAKRFRVGENHVDSAHKLLVNDPERFERVAAGLEPLPNKKGDIGHCVYLIGHRNRPNLPIKIGKAINLSSRLSTLQCGHYTELVVLLFIPGYSELEKELHTRFSKKHVRGEWFNLSQEDVDLIKKEYGV